MAAAPQPVPCWASVWRRATTTGAMRWGVVVGVVLGRLCSAALQEGSVARERSRPVERQRFAPAHARQRSSRGSPARDLSMARGRRCACAWAMGDALGACCHTGQTARCARCYGTVRLVVEVQQAASVVRTIHGSISLRRVAAACRGAWAWSAPAGNAVRATCVGRPAAGGGAPVRPCLPLGPSGLPPRAPYGGGPSPSVAMYGRWPSAGGTLGPPRPTSRREVAGRFQRPSPAVGGHTAHAASATAPPSPP